MMKHIKRTLFFLLIGGYAISLGVSPSSRLSAQGIITTEECCGDFSDQIWPARFDIGYRCGRFIGIRQNYAEAGLFLMQEPSCCSICEPFIDLRAAYLQKNEWAANGGLGVRIRTDWYTWGINGFYDHQKSHIRSLQRVGAGFEFLSSCFDLRINGYYPINDVRHGRRHVFRYILGNYIEICQEREHLYKGIDAEIGVPLWSGCSFSIYGGIGPYYYYSKKIESLAGGQARLEIAWAKYLWIEGRFSYDHKYKSRAQGAITLSIPLLRICGDIPCEDLLCIEDFIKPVQRTNIMFTTRCCHWKPHGHHSSSSSSSSSDSSSDGSSSGSGSTSSSSGSSSSSSSS
jgi:uncharacterized membrane protein YgcG